MLSAQRPSANCPPTNAGEVAGGKRGNPSQDRSRGVTGIRKSVKNLSEVCQFPVLTCYQNPTTGKLEVIRDKFTMAKVKDDQNMLKKLDLYLSLSVESGESFTFADMKELWIQSRNVKIYNTEYLAEKPRTAYFRPTENNLSSCKDYWNGDDHLLLKVSKDKVGYQVQIVSINLLLEYSWIFTKLGGSERRFLASHNNRMRFQYGVELHHLLPWYI